MRRRIVIYGAGGMARWVCPEMIATGCDFEVAGFVTDDAEGQGGSLFDMPISAFDTVEAEYPPDQFQMLVLTGYRRMRERRTTIDRARKKGYSLCSFISRRAITYPDLIAGDNVVIGPGVYVGPGCRLGENVTIAQSAHIGTGASVSAHSYIAGRAVIGGLAVVGELCFVGLNATVVDRAELGQETFVAAGAVVRRVTEPFSQYVGNPAVSRGEHRDGGMVFFE